MLNGTPGHRIVSLLLWCLHLHVLFAIFLKFCASCIGIFRCVGLDYNSRWRDQICCSLGWAGKLLNCQKLVTIQRRYYCNTEELQLSTKLAISSSENTFSNNTSVGIFVSCRLWKRGPSKSIHDLTSSSSTCTLLGCSCVSLFPLLIVSRQLSFR